MYSYVQKVSVSNVSCSNLNVYFFGTSKLNLPGPPSITSPSVVLADSLQQMSGEAEPHAFRVPVVQRSPAFRAFTVSDLVGQDPEPVGLTHLPAGCNNQ